MADEALANADIDDTEALLPPPEVIVIDDDNDVPLPPRIKQTLANLQKIEPSDAPSPHLPTLQSPNPTPPVRRNPPPPMESTTTSHRFSSLYNCGR